MNLSQSPSSATITPPPPPPPPYSLQDFVVYTAPGTDLPGQPISGTVAQCQVQCSANSSCVGFSRPKNVSIDVSNSCWLKQNISDNRVSGQGYQTYVKL
jgi:cytoskeletal protein RodZ